MLGYVSPVTGAAAGHPALVCCGAAEYTEVPVCRLSSLFCFPVGLECQGSQG